MNIVDNVRDKLTEMNPTSNLNLYNFAESLKSCDWGNGKIDQNKEEVCLKHILVPKSRAVYNLRKA